MYDRYAGNIDVGMYISSGKPAYLELVAIAKKFDYHGCLQDPESKVHGANIGPTWVLSATDGPHVGPMNLAVLGALLCVIV